MTVRPAKFADILRLCDLARDMHARSRYAAYAETPSVAAEFKKLLVRGIQAHGKQTCLFVATRDGKIEGFVYGLIDKVYHVLPVFRAVDLFLYVTEGGDPRHWAGLLDAYENWAWSVPKTIEVDLTNNSAIVPAERTDALYRRRGYVRDGSMWRKERP